MRKFKIFVFDDLVIGGTAATRFMCNQTYCFPLFTGAGYGLFHNKKTFPYAALVENAAFKGAWGDLWEVDQATLDRVNARYALKKAHQVEMYMEGMSTVITWTTGLKDLKGCRMKQIADYRDTL